MSLEPHQQRVVDEKRELDERIAKLHAFQSNPIFKSLPPAEIGRLYRQENAMREYSAVLAERIQAFPPPAPKPEPAPVDRSQVVLTNGKPVPEDGSHRELRDDGQQRGYVVLSAEERAKGFVRPVRRGYLHVGRSVCANTRPPAEQLGGGRYVCGLPHHHAGECGQWIHVAQPLHAQLARTHLLGGCGSLTTMGQALAETYARDPHFYSGTFCCACGKHFPVGDDGEFVWEGTPERVGT